VPGGGGAPSRAALAQYRRSAHVRFSVGVKLWANSIHIGFVSNVGQSGRALQAATASELSHCRSS
jgi:hypothetical protein